MTDKNIIKDHFSETADVWRDNIYGPDSQQGLFKYYDKQYRFDYVVQMIPPVKPGTQRALDVGHGAGQLLPILAGLGYETYGIDVSPQMKELAQQLCDQKKIKVDLQLSDCEKLPYPDNFFNLYVAMGVIEYMDSDIPMLKEIERVLCPGGIAIITTRNIRSIHVRWRSVYQSLFEIKVENLIRFILGKKTRTYNPISKEHDPHQFRKQLSSFPFKYLDEKYAHFHALPAPLNRCLPWIESILGKTMEKHWSSSRFPFMASTYIVKFQKLVK